MPHPEQEHALMIEVARLQKRVDDGDATARILVKDVRAWSDTCDKLRNERDALRAEVNAFRKLLWLRHGCSVADLYGDDGEMQCGNACCILDFKRQSAEEIEARWIAVNRAALAGGGEDG